MNEVLPCPFCGSTPVVETGTEGDVKTFWWCSVSCQNFTSCGVIPTFRLSRGQPGEAAIRKMVLARWNNRAPELVKAPASVAVEESSASFIWSWFQSNPKWLRERTIFISRHGSHAYGTSTPDSDVDLRGIAIAQKSYYLGSTHTFEQSVQSHPVDLTIFDLRKFVKLATDANPNVLEILFTEPSDHLYVRSPMSLLLDSRDLFLSAKAKHTFSGYARAQLKRIKGHHKWLRDPPKGPPTREEFGLPERTVIPADQLLAAQSAIEKQKDSWSWRELEHVDPATKQALQDEFERRLLEITQWHWEEVEDRTWLSAARTIGLDENFIRLMDMERRYTAKLREWQQYNHWKATRNPARAELEAKWGYDTKHAMHLVRLTRMCREILTTGKVIVRRPDAGELLTIRNGAWSYEQLLEYSLREDLELSELAKTTKLPQHPDRDKIDALCVEMIERMG